MVTVSRLVFVLLILVFGSFSAHAQATDTPTPTLIPPVFAFTVVPFYPTDIPSETPTPSATAPTPTATLNAFMLVSQQGEHSAGVDLSASLGDIIKVLLLSMLVAERLFAYVMRLRRR